MFKVFSFWVFSCMWLNLILSWDFLLPPLFPGEGSKIYALTFQITQLIGSKKAPNQMSLTLKLEVFPQCHRAALSSIMTSISMAHLIGMSAQSTKSREIWYY